MNIETIVNEFETRAGTLLQGTTRDYSNIVKYNHVALSYIMIHLIWFMW